ncbi:hypothetical protein [Mycobacteroides abscessus]|uniref:hypothetical protein n=1 Tax=Mycobacteroides abscessus TaxID=36809 RepID=UPI0009274C69|nr:hypothetical protein [Mycobacteroides abscessus]MDM2421121.1 hypothetical protein [Mycobacteroides abscessus]MDM2424748.1 hypothetical protein [Mycobacteroides abscessus]MDM2430424.1 hypothetical protein [Mycobacteroides abscessus]MDM2435315.1 hypothetical protein [Mycobacteroides abscessus]MDM2438261.1 hypothetical protein [Mycobacteroides abscessus]
MQKPTKAFADMVLELADKLEAVLNEMYPDGQLIPVFVSPESLRASARDLTRNAEDTQRSAEPSLAPSRFAPLYPVTLYQAGCTSCGAVSPAEIDEHLVCVEHEDHDFSDAPIDVSEVGS